MFPEIKLSDSIVLPTYLLYLSFLYCFLIFYVVQRARKHDMSIATTLDFALLLMVSGFVGGRLFHVFYEAPEHYQEDWLRVFKFWEGGFVFFGGALLAFVVCFAFAYWKKLPFLKWADFYSPVFALGYGLGRVSCFLAGCCYGRSCDVPWGVRFAWDHQQILRHPVQLYSVLWELVTFGVLIWLEKKREKKSLFNGNSGRLFSLWLILHSLGRLMMEYFREDFRGSFILGLSISSWISLLILAAAAAFFAARSRKA